MSYISIIRTNNQISIFYVNKTDIKKKKKKDKMVIDVLTVKQQFCNIYVLVLSYNILYFVCFVDMQMKTKQTNMWYYGSVN